MCPITAEIMRDPVSTADGASAVTSPFIRPSLGPPLPFLTPRRPTFPTPIRPFVYSPRVPPHTTIAPRPGCHGTPKNQRDTQERALPAQATPSSGSQPCVSQAATVYIPGHTFERVAIERWLRMHSTSPMTGAALPHKHLVPAISLRQLIVEFSGAGPDGSGPTIAAGRGRGGGGDGCVGRAWDLTLL